MSPFQSLPGCVGAALATVAFVFPACAQAPLPPVGKPVSGQSSSTFSYEFKSDEQTITINNVAYDLVQPYVPGKQTDLLVLRVTTKSKQVMGDIGMEGSVTVEAWPLGTDFGEKPRYAVTLDGAGVNPLRNSVLVFDRALEEVQWWSVHALTTGKHLFDTYVEPLVFSVSRESDTPRIAGLEVPPDDIKDARLKDPHVVAVLSYASAERVVREALLTCDDPKRAELYRSFADEERKVEYVEGPTQPAQGKTQPEPTRALKITWSQSFPAPANPVSAQIPVAGDDLDLAHAKLPPCMHAAVFNR
ncbi:MAG TPA: hypothetical protein VMG55_05455 [Stellaceae bacterium]|nr:hypothetical protein [Stellaceae bacterium]